MDYFLLASRQTPEALTLDLSLQVPPSFEEWGEAQRKKWLLERSVAAQRGWMLEEASHLLDSFSRDYSNGLLPLVLDLYDASDQSIQRNTISRGREEIENAYLSIFGATTYEAMAKHLKERAHWHNGLWPRFAFIVDDSTGTWQFWPPKMNYPTELVNKLRYIAFELFPLPKTHLTEHEVGKGKNLKKVKEIKVDEPLVASEAILTPEAREQWEKYSKATGFDMLPDEPEAVPAKFYGNYGRLGTMLIKTAMILAAFDAKTLPVTITVQHVYRAQMIVETFRSNLHKLFSRLDHIKDDPVADRILGNLRSVNGQFVSRRELLRALNKRWFEIEQIMMDLIASGEVERKTEDNARGPASELYRWVG